MTVEHAASAWETMLTEANGTSAAASSRSALQRSVIGALRTISFLLLATLAILVLLPAALTAQAAMSA